MPQASIESYAFATVLLVVHDGRHPLKKNLAALGS